MPRAFLLAAAASVVLLSACTAAPAGRTAQPTAAATGTTAADRSHFAAVDRNASAVLLAADAALRKQFTDGQHTVSRGELLATAVWYQTFRTYEQNRGDIHSQAAKVLLGTDHVSEAFHRWDHDFSEADIAVLHYSRDVLDGPASAADDDVKKALAALDLADADARDVAAGR
ncbi:hypothetical protein [Kitasatospora sp. NPDC085879]|uniref:hypothetical protein n=1 Tax=Kitasatospora sp. NPDC085879 TaxID=3154769 RepID=UPI0034298B81